MIGAGSDEDPETAVGVDGVVFDHPTCVSDGDPNLPSETEGIFVAAADVEAGIDESTAEIGFCDDDVATAEG